MKKIKFFLGTVAVFAVTFFSACHFNICSQPTLVYVTISPIDTTIVFGDSVSFSVTLTPDAINDGELSEFSVETADGTELYSQSFTGGKTVTFSYSYTVPADATVGEDITLTFKATDGNSGLETQTNATITVDSDLPKIVTATDIQSNYVSINLDNSMMFVLGETGVTTADGNSTDGDLAFVYQSTYGYSVCSPNAAWIATIYSYNGITYSTSNKKETKIALYSGSWADLNQTTINALTVTTSTLQGGGNGVQNLNEGDIVVFETADGRKGALLVKTNAKVSMYMTADLMYQATPASAGK